MHHFGNSQPIMEQIALLFIHIIAVEFLLDILILLCNGLPLLPCHRPMLPQVIKSLMKFRL